MTKYYKAYGQKIASDIELPELAHASTEPSEYDVRIRLGRISSQTAGEGGYRFGEAAHDVATFSCPGVADYHVRGGREILVQPNPGADVALVRLFVLGSAMALILNQREILCLHCSAVAFDGKVVAFAGDQEEGKSTLAAHCMALEGAVLVSDDVLAIAPDGGETPMALPGIPNLKLWRRSLETLGRDASRLRADWYRADKFHVPVADNFATAPLPLTHFYALVSDEAAGSGVFERLRGSAALDTLLVNTYRLESLDDGEQRARHFQALAKLERGLEVWRFRRARDLARVGESARRIRERHR